MACPIVGDGCAGPPLLHMRSFHDWQPPYKFTRTVVNVCPAGGDFRNHDRRADGVAWAWIAFRSSGSSYLIAGPGMQR
jgi:hypothetical protein